MGSVRAAVIESGNQELWKALEGSIVVPHGSEFVYGVATDCDVAEVRFQDMNNRIARVGLPEFLVQQIAQNRSFLHWVLDETLPILNKENVSQLVDAAFAFLNANNPASLESDAIEQILGVVSVTIANQGPIAAKDKVKGALQNGAISAYLHKLTSSGEEGSTWSETFTDILALALLSLKHEKLSVPNAAQHPQYGDISASVTWFNSLIDGDTYEDSQILALCEAIKRFRIAYIFVAAAGDNECKRALYKKVGVELIRDGSQKPLAGTDFVLRFDKLIALLGDDESPLLEYGGNIDDTIGWNKVDVLTLPISLVNLVSTDETDKWPKLMTMLDEALKERAATDWERDIADGTHILTLAKQRISSRQMHLPIDKFKEPIVGHILKVASGDGDGQRHLDVLLTGLPTTSARAVPGTFLERLQQTAVTPSGISKLISGAPDLMSKVPFEKHPSTTIEKILIPAMEALNGENSRFALRHAKEFKKSLGTLDEDVSKRLIETIKGVKPAADQEVDIQAIAEALDLEIDENPSVQNPTTGTE